MRLYSDKRAQDRCLRTTYWESSHHPWGSQARVIVSILAVCIPLTNHLQSLNIKVTIVPRNEGSCKETCKNLLHLSFSAQPRKVRKKLCISGRWPTSNTLAILRKGEPGLSIFCKTVLLYHFYAPVTIVRGISFAPVRLGISLSVCPSFHHTLRYRVCVFNYSFSINRIFFRPCIRRVDILEMCIFFFLFELELILTA